MLTDTQGLDHIIGYNWEAFVNGDAGPVNQDVMNFHDFFVNSPVAGGAADADNHVIYTGTPASIFPLPFGTPAHDGTWDHDVTVDANNNAGNSLVVLSSNGLTLTAADFSINQLGTIQLNDNARAVVVLGTDQTGIDSGISHFDIYFVQDIDTGKVVQLTKPGRWIWSHRLTRSHWSVLLPCTIISPTTGQCKVLKL